MKAPNLRKILPVIPLFLNYNLSKLVRDALAGFTVGVTEIPQAISYAAAAGLPPQYGLYSGLLDGYIYTILGTCKDLNIGPSAILSVLIATVGREAGPEGVALVTFCSGVLIILITVLRLGLLVDFMSFPVLSGFICASVIAIGTGQLIPLLGMNGRSGNIVETMTAIVGNIGSVRLWDSLLGVFSLIFLLVMTKIQSYARPKKNPDWSPTKNFFSQLTFFFCLAKNGTVVVVATLLAYLLREYQPFKITGNVGESFPAFRLPNFNNIIYNGTSHSFGNLVGSYPLSFFFIPIISILEASLITKVFTQGKKVETVNELVAVGLCNLFGSFLGSMPVTGSLSRSLVNHTSGVKTTLAGSFASLLLFLTVVFLTSIFYYVPKATLAAILINCGIQIIDLKSPVLLWKTKKLDLIPFCITAIGGIFLGLDYGAVLGILVNILFILYASARPEIPLEKNDSDIYIYTLKDTIYFPCADFLRDQIIRLNDDVTIVIDGRNVTTCDVTIAKSISTVVNEMALQRKCKIFLVGFKNEVQDVLLGADPSLKDYFFVNLETVK